MTEEIEKTDFPSNSRKSSLEAEIQPGTKHVQKIVSGEVSRKKKSLIDRFSETFFGDDAKSVGSYVVWEVLLPAAKNTISDMVSTGIEMLLFGDSSSSGRRRSRDFRDDRGKPYVSYTNYYGRDRDRRERVEPSPRARNLHNFDEIIFGSRQDAKDVLDQMLDLIESYDEVTVEDFYDSVGMTTDFADNKYGWTNLNTAKIQPVRGGFVLLLPRPIVLE